MLRQLEETLISPSSAHCTDRKSLLQVHQLSRTCHPDGNVRRDFNTLSPVCDGLCMISWAVYSETKNQGLSRSLPTTWSSWSPPAGPSPFHIADTPPSCHLRGTKNHHTMTEGFTENRNQPAPTEKPQFRRRHPRCRSSQIPCSCTKSGSTGHASSSSRKVWAALWDLNQTASKNIQGISKKQIKCAKKLKHCVRGHACHCVAFLFLCDVLGNPNMQTIDLVGFGSDHGLSRPENGYE